MAQRRAGRMFQVMQKPAAFIVCPGFPGQQFKQVLVLLLQMSDFAVNTPDPEKRGAVGIKIFLLVEYPGKQGQGSDQCLPFRLQSYIFPDKMGRFYNMFFDRVVRYLQFVGGFGIRPALHLA